MKDKLIPVGAAKCPYCGKLVENGHTGEIQGNKEFTARCYFPCRELFAIRHEGYKVITAKIAWDEGITMWRQDTPLSEVPEAIE